MPKLTEEEDLRERGFIPYPGRTLSLTPTHSRDDGSQELENRVESMVITRAKNEYKEVDCPHCNERPCEARKNKKKIWRLLKDAICLGLPSSKKRDYCEEWMNVVLQKAPSPCTMKIFDEAFTDNDNV